MFETFNAPILFFFCWFHPQLLVWLLRVNNDIWLMLTTWFWSHSIHVWFGLKLFHINTFRLEWKTVASMVGLPLQKCFHYPFVDCFPILLQIFCLQTLGGLVDVLLMFQLEMRCCIMQKERNFLKVAIVIAEILFTLLCMSCMKQFAKIAL